MRGNGISDEGYRERGMLYNAEGTSVRGGGGMRGRFCQFDQWSCVL